MIEQKHDLTPSELRRRLTFVIQRGVRRGQIDVLNENTQEATIGRNETVQRIFREVLASESANRRRAVDAANRAQVSESIPEQDTDPPNIPQPLIDAAGELPTEQDAKLN